MDKYVLAVDCGTESIRAAVVDEHGTILGTGNCENKNIFSNSGWVEQSPVQWKKSFITAIRKAISDSKVDGKKISAVSGDATSPTLIALDKNGKEIMNAIMWMDIRAKKEAEKLSSIENEVLKYVGYGNISPEWFPCKALWLKNNMNDVYKKAKYILDQPDWVNYFLTGNLTLNINSSTARGFYNIYKGGFPEDYYRQAGIEDVLEKYSQSVYRPGEIVGELSKRISDETGLREGIPVACAGADGYIGVFGVNALEEGRFALITGSSQLIIGLSKKEIHFKGMNGSFPDALLKGYNVIEAGQTSTGSVIKWFCDNFINTEIIRKAEKNKTTVYEILDIMADTVSPGSEGLVVLEHWQGNRTPWANPYSRGVIRGLSLSHTPAHIFRALLEGTAYGTAVILDRFDKQNVNIHELVACGGATESDVWMQICADVTGRPITIPEERQAVLLGSAILAFVSNGHYSSINEAAESMVKVRKIIDPIERNHEIYDEYVKQYEKTYETLKELSKNLIETTYK